MALAPGTRIGLYEIGSALGAGGMGEVYRAKDTRLGRAVALKTLPPEFALDPDRRARFEREAKTLATLNHPHIAQIYGLEEVPGVDGAPPMLALAMELVEGEDLAQRISRGSVPLDEALPLARQIAEGLEAAHEAGIVHRDLKPANIRVTPDGVVKVLDFGLAKPMEPVAGSVMATHSPTLTSPALTTRGVVLGTAAYMAPEQAKGKPVDRRADIWAFGCVLYELLTGRRAFEGEDVTDILAAIVKTEPDWTKLPATTPRHIRTLLTRCLAKDRTHRLQHIGDARLELGEIDHRETSSDGTPTVARGVRASVVIAATVGAALVASVATWYARTPEPGGPLPRIRADGPAFNVVGNATSPLFLSPEGDQLLFRTINDDGTSAYHLRDLPTGSDRTFIKATAQYGQAAWSPAGARVFMSSARQQYALVDVASLSVRLLELPWQQLGFSWINESDVLIASQDGLFRLRVDGGTPVPVPTPPGESRTWPSMLPDGRRYLFLRGSDTERDLCVGSVETTEASCMAKTARFAYGRGSVILLVPPDGRLLAQRFVPTSGLLTGAPEEIAAAIHVNSVADGAFLNSATISRSGVVAYARPLPTAMSTLVWLDRAGARQEPSVDTGPGQGFDLASGGRWAATSVTTGSERGVYALDLDRGVRSRLSMDAAPDVVLSPDGRSLVYATGRQLIVQGVEGGAARTVLTASPGGNVTVEDWTRDGRIIAMRWRGVQRVVVAVDSSGAHEPTEITEGLPSSALAKNGPPMLSTSDPGCERDRGSGS